jgi:thymidylate kinase
MSSMKSITIYEGPDGGGKTTAAVAFARKSGALYVHNGPFIGEAYITHHYLNGMAPALMGLHDVVMDRCWISEFIYGVVHRAGANRVSDVDKRFLEGTAFRLCRTQVLIYTPPIQVCLDNFNRRRGTEYLDSEQKLKDVYRLYWHGGLTELPTSHVDYTKELANGK